MFSCVIIITFQVFWVKTYFKLILNWDIHFELRYSLSFEMRISWSPILFAKKPAHFLSALMAMLSSFSGNSCDLEGIMLVLEKITCQKFENQFWNYRQLSKPSVKALYLLEACFDLISGSSLHMKIQIMGGKITENLGFNSPLPKGKFFWKWNEKRKRKFLPSKAGICTPDFQ